VNSRSRNTPQRAYSDGSYRRSSGRGHERGRRSRGERWGGNEGGRERYQEPRYGGDGDRDSEDGGGAQGGLVRILRLGVRALGSGLGGG
jgi:hypothetical protein